MSCTIEILPQLWRAASGLLSGARSCAAAGEVNFRREMKFVLRFAGNGVRVVVTDTSVVEGMGCWFVYSRDKAA